MEDDIHFQQRMKERPRHFDLETSTPISLLRLPLLFIRLQVEGYT